eukprot:357523-Chlamydomonas_euryale.AAC.17
MHEFAKPEFPHERDRVMRLRHIGAAAARRLADAHRHLPGSPVHCVLTVGQLRELVGCVGDDAGSVDAMLKLLHMMGRHKHKWHELRGTLTNCVVGDDVANRAWVAPAARSGVRAVGLLFAASAGAVRVSRPVGERHACDPHCVAHCVEGCVAHCVA